MGRISAVLAAALLMMSAAQAVADESREKANLPETDIFLFDLNLGADDVLSNKINATPRGGYDNQPAFTPDSQGFLYSRGDDYQTDVYEYDLASGSSHQITDTVTNEFSPTASPDNSVISFVTGGPKSVQNIAEITRAKPAEPAFILPGQTLRDHASGNVLFWSRYGFNVTLANTDSSDATYISEAIPSTPHLIPGTSNFSFVHRQGNGETWIKELNSATKAVRPLAPIMGPNANYAWTPDGSVLMIQDGQLYRFQEATGKGWVKVSDLTEKAITGAARLSVSPDGQKIAIVGLPAKP